MDKKTLRQCNMDVIRLENAAERLSRLADDYEQALAKLEVARSALKVISTWAACSNNGGDMQKIETRCMDTLKLIE